MSMRMHNKLNYDESLAWYLLSRSNMDHCLVDETEGVNELCIERSSSRILWQDISTKSHIWTTDETSEGFYEYS
jgi:hypothetical protein